MKRIPNKTWFLAVICLLLGVSSLEHTVVCHPVILPFFVCCLGMGGQCGIPLQQLGNDSGKRSSPSMVASIFPQAVTNEVDATSAGMCTKRLSGGIRWLYLVFFAFICRKVKAREPVWRQRENWKIVEASNENLCVCECEEKHPVWDLKY